MNEAVEPERETLDWETYGRAARDLAHEVADSGFRPDIILAIARGGLFAAGSLGYALSVKNLFVMNLEFYTGVGERLDMPVVLPPYLDKLDLTDARILVVDDVADTGHTLKVVHEFCQDVVSESMTAVLYEKSHSVVKADFVWKRTDRWINFPWSTEPPVVDESGEKTVRDA
ncbi:MAG: phosphoribosyltransferase [Acidimicrobiales bacterium]